MAGSSSSLPGHRGRHPWAKQSFRASCTPGPLAFMAFAASKKACDMRQRQKKKTRHAKERETSSVREQGSLTSFNFSSISKARMFQENILNVLLWTAIFLGRRDGILKSENAAKRRCRGTASGSTGTQPTCDNYEFQHARSYTQCAYAAEHIWYWYLPLYTWYEAWTTCLNYLS